MSNTVVMPAADYDEDYFDGGVDCHPAGYTEYKRSSVYDALTGYEKWKQKAWKFWQKYQDQFPNGPSDVKILDIGCGKGFLVQDLRELGFDAWGIDISPYAISQAAPEVAPFLSVGDIKNLASYGVDEFDAVVGFRVLPCFTNAELLILSPEIVRISKKQFFLIDCNDYYTAEELQVVNQYYNMKTKEQWQNLMPKSAFMIATKKDDSEFD